MVGRGSPRLGAPAQLPPTTRTAGSSSGSPDGSAIGSIRAGATLAEEFGDDWPPIERDPRPPTHVHQLDRAGHHLSSTRTLSTSLEEETIAPKRWPACPKRTEPSARPTEISWSAS